MVCTDNGYAPEEMLRICKAQEEGLWFDRFSREDALNLGLLIHQTANALYGRGAGITIQLYNATVFSFLPEGTTIDNLRWMDRKRNVTALTGMSSLCHRYFLLAGGETLADRGLDAFEYTDCGGSFPLCIRGVGQVGVLCVSALPHLDDHQLIVHSLKTFLNRPEVPDLPCCAADNA